MIATITTPALKYWLRIILCKAGVCLAFLLLGALIALFLVPPPVWSLPVHLGLLVVAGKYPRRTSKDSFERWLNEYAHNSAINTAVAEGRLFSYLVVDGKSGKREKVLACNPALLKVGAR